MNEKNLHLLIFIVLSIILSIIIYYQHTNNSKILFIIINYGILYLIINAIIKNIKTTYEDYEKEMKQIDDLFGL